MGELPVELGDGDDASGGDCDLVCEWAGDLGVPSWRALSSLRSLKERSLSISSIWWSRILLRGVFGGESGGNDWLRLGD